MKIYLVWAYDQYYPTGPGDLRGIFLTWEEAKDCLHQMGNYDYKSITEWGI